MVANVEPPARRVSAVEPADSAHALGYRPALDGVRALAVLSVIGYHLGYRQVRGGFVGVDLFFVLSGYLITSLLLIERTTTGGISLLQFWIRRAKRLLPALLLLLVAIALWVHATARPFELALRQQDLLWTLFYGANWHLIASAQDYFAQAASASPLRHTWSLAIEEQFYLAWPVIVLAALSFSRRRPAALLTICGVGIVASALAMTWLFNAADPSRAYFGTDSRIHQPLIGALLAVLCSYRLPRSVDRAAPIFTGVGVLALASALIFLSDRQPIYWKGLSVVLAVAAAFLILGLERSPNSRVARVLSRQPFRWIGQISYGLYLWHWPVIFVVTSAPRPFSALPGSLGVNVFRVLLTFAIATASFYLLEQPVRRSRVPIIGQSRSRFAAATGFSMALVAALILWSTRNATGDIAAQDIPGCPATGDTLCVRVEGPSGAPVVAVTGDSIARSLDPAFMKLAQDHHWTYLLAAKNACRVTHLLTSYEGQVRAFDQQCYETTPRLARLLLRWRPSVIVAIDRWEIMDFVTPEGELFTRGTPQHIDLTERALEAVALELTSNGSRLAFMELPPALNSDCGGALPLDSPSCHPLVSEDVAQAPYNAAFKRVAARVPRVDMLSITDTVCPNGVCSPSLNGTVLRFDGLHFSPSASLLLAPVLYRQLVAVGLPPG